MAHVRPARGVGVRPGAVFRPWAIPGCKCVLHTGLDLVFCAGDGTNRVCACLALNLEAGAACHVTVPVGSRRTEGVALCLRLAGDSPECCRARAVTRVDLMHMRCLQAFDTLQDGGTQRDVAVVLFGVDAVAAHWHADSELRAQVRHIIARARALVGGGYLRLAGCAEVHPA